MREFANTWASVLTESTAELKPVTMPLNGLVNEELSVKELELYDKSALPEAKLSVSNMRMPAITKEKKKKHNRERIVSIGVRMSSHRFMDNTTNLTLHTL